MLELLRRAGGNKQCSKDSQSETCCAASPIMSCILPLEKMRGWLRRDSTHSISFHFTPKHASWLNQIEIWFSILARKLLRRGNFKSTAELKSRIEAFIAYFNETMAKPFRWTFTGKPLTA